MRAFGCFIHVASDLSSASVLAVSLALVLVSSPCHALGAADSAPPLPGSIRTDAASITYFARAGDTLTSIARQFTDKSSNWIALGKLNRIDRQSAIPIGTTILIPGELLGDTPSKATVVAMTGSITAHAADGARTRLSVGATVLEGTQIDTGANSFLTLALPDESRISVPSNTSVRLAKLRSSRYLNSPRTQVTLLRGRVESRVTPLEANRGRYEVQTPLSIAGVRGTHFRVGVIGDGRTARVATETLDGKVAVNTGSSTNTSDKLILTTGRGNITDAGTVGPARDLLPAPRLSGASAGGFAEFPANRINLVGLAGAAAYHLQIATDAKATDLVAETRSATTTLAIDGVADGNYHGAARLAHIGTGAGVTGLGAGLAKRPRAA